MAFLRYQGRENSKTIDFTVYQVWQYF